MSQREINWRNSSRVLGSSLNTPVIELVTVLLSDFSTPLITIHKCLHTVITHRLVNFVGIDFKGPMFYCITCTYVPISCRATCDGNKIWNGIKIGILA